MKKARIIGFDFVRFIATLCIVIFHFMPNMAHIYPDKVFFFNYDLAQVGVSLFFILSGAALYYNNPDNTNLKNYYIKRFLALFPMFYIAYISIFLISFWTNGHITPGVPIVNIVYSIIGIDGLLSYKLPVFCMTGEWFFGCIIIIYLLFPFIKHLINKYPKFIFTIFILTYVVLIYNYPFDMPMIFNPCIRIIEFIFGIAYIKYFANFTNDNINNFSLNVFLSSLSIALCMLYISVPIHQMLKISIGGAAIFVFLMETSKLIKNHIFIRIIKFISKYSFAIFLVHHFIANIIVYHFVDKLRISEVFCVTIIYFILIILFGVLLYKVTNIIVDKIKSLYQNKKSI